MSASLFLFISLPSFIAGTWTLFALAIQLYHLKYPAPHIPTSLLLNESSSINKLLAKALAEQRDILLKDRIPPPPPPTSPTITRLLSLILRDFVSNWFSQISNDPSFVHVIHARLSRAVEELERRFQLVSLDSLLIEKVAPSLINHLVEFRRAEQAVRGTGHDRVLTESLELQELVASKYIAGGKLHPALHLNGSTSLSEQTHLRAVADRLLSFILVGAPELQSPISRSLIREILVCVVIKPAIDSLSDPYLWNNVVDHWAGKAVRELHMVFKFRQVLEKQAQSVNQGAQIRSYDGLIRNIKSCKSLIDAKQIRNQIIMEVRRRRLEILNRQPSDTVDGVKVSSIIRHMNRLISAKSKVEKRIEILGGPAYIPRNRTVGLSSQHLSMSQLLASSAGLSFFIEYMDQVKHTNLLQFWLMAQSFREHLSTSASPAVVADVEKLYSTFFAPNCPQFIQLPVNLSLQIAHLANNLPTEQVSEPPRPILEDSLAPIPTFTSKLSASSSSFSRSSSFSSSISTTVPGTTVSLYQPLLDAQAYVTQVMEAQHFTEFVKSDLYLALINDPAFSAETAVSESIPSSNNESSSSSVSDAVSGVTSILTTDGNLSCSILDLRQITDEALLPLDTVESIDAELRLILDTELAPKEIETPPPTFSTLKTTDSDVFSLIEASTSLSDADPPSHNRSQSHSSEQSRASDSSSATPSAYVEPAVQNHVRQNIDKLLQQEAIVDSLLANAQQAGKNAELISVLVKSKATLHNEMRELLWQEIQDEKSGEASVSTSQFSVSVVSHRLEKEGSREYAVFMVEVKPMVNGSEGGPGWVVSRRFSEFLTLHTMLKSQYPGIMSGYDLPKKVPNLILSDSMLLILAASRQEKLDKYLKEICKHQQVYESRVFRSFIYQEELDVGDQTSRPVSVGTDRSTSSSLRSFRGKSALSNSGSSGVSFLKQWQRKFITSMESLSPVSPPSPISPEEDGLSSTLPAAPVGSTLGSSRLMSASALTLHEGASPAISESTFFGMDKSKLRSLGLQGSEVGDLGGRQRVNEDKASDVISELFIEVFELKERNNWFRRQAILIVLQQLLGDTIDRKVTSSIEFLTSSAMLESYVTALTDLLWPNGEWNKEYQVPTENERERVKQGAKQKIMLLIPELMFSLVGRQNATKGALRLFSITQNQLLNRHILYSLLDHVVDAIISVPSE